MKHLIWLMAIYISACAFNSNHPDSKNYRMNGDSHDISITGRAELNEDLIQDLNIMILFDGAEIIKGAMESNYKDNSIELYGARYEGKDTSAVCHTKFNDSAEMVVECNVYIGTQKALTLALIPTIVN